MNRFLPPLVVLCSLVSSCSDSPESVFGKAVLNLNLFHGFAGPAMERELEQPSVKLAANGKDVVPMTRKEMVEMKLRAAEESLAKVRKLSATDETKELVAASVAVHEFIIPVFRNEYMTLAEFYDSGAPKDRIGQLSQTIRGTYAEGFRSRMDAVVAAAKPYAERHGLKVNWDVRTSPAP